MARKYEQKTYMEPVGIGLGGWLKRLVILLAILVVIAMVAA